MIYIVRVIENNHPYDYEYGNLKHATEHFDNEQNAYLLKYKNGEDIVLKFRKDGTEIK